jgi:hypothetical protein
MLQCIFALYVNCKTLYHDAIVLMTTNYPSIVSFQYLGLQINPFFPAPGMSLCNPEDQRVRNMIPYSRAPSFMEVEHDLKHTIQNWLESKIIHDTWSNNLIYFNTFLLFHIDSLTRYIGLEFVKRFPPIIIPETLDSDPWPLECQVAKAAHFDDGTCAARVPLTLSQRLARTDNYIRDQIWSRFLETRVAPKRGLCAQLKLLQQLTDVTGIPFRPSSLMTNRVERPRLSIGPFEYLRLSRPPHERVALKIIKEITIAADVDNATYIPA